ncbi:MAG: response regulator [Candidatus Dormibacteraeota bacterium]|nr:response regulator [Candidatus Dormibacteraeota bacterium]
MIRVLLADGSERIIANLTRRLSTEENITICGTAADGEGATQESLHLRPDVAVVDANLPGMDGIQVTEMLAQFVPDAGVILMSLDSETDLFRRAMLAGAREVLQKPFRGDELVSAIHRVNEFQERKRVSAAVAVESAQSNGSVPAAAEAPPPEGRLFTVLSGKGGVGKTVVATNLAVALAGRADQRVALVDLSLQFGDVAALLDVKAQRTIADLAAHDAVADREVVQDVLATTPSGLHVLPAPTSPELADYVTTHHLRALLDELRRSHELVVADTTSQLGEVTLEAVESSERIVLLTDFSVTGVKNTRLLMTVLNVLKVTEERLVLVANNRDPRSENSLERAQAETFLHSRIALDIPYDPAVVGGSVSHGTPFVTSAPQSPAARAINQLADLLATRELTAASGGVPSRKRQRRLLGFARE